MTESELHQSLKKVMCGCSGSPRTEYPLSTRQRLDCVNETTQQCAEIELSSSKIPYSIEKLERAKSEGKCNKPILVVRPQDFAYAKLHASNHEIDVRTATREVLLEAIGRCIISSRGPDKRVLF